MGFVQAPPELGNQYHDDGALRSCLARLLPADVRRAVEPSLVAMGARAGGELYRLHLQDLPSQPVLTQWDAWGNRVDRIDLTPAWRAAERIAAEEGLVATAYERAHGRYSRIHQFALAYLFAPSTDLYSCPLAMTDGAARALLASGNRALIERAVPRLTSREPARFWTSGQWMTEAIGGSDVGLTETVARQKGGRWRLYGRKWFTSAIASPMALTLARPEGNPPGGRGLALFYVEARDEAGRPQAIVVHRLKDKLGTRKVPTAELELNGAPAELVCGPLDGVRNIAPMLNITRAWNTVTACALMRRGLALARDYAGRRVAFGAALMDKPLHVDTLAGLEAEFEGAQPLAFFVAELPGRSESGPPGAAYEQLLRLVTPLAKLATARQAVEVLSEAIEAFGGAGYVEDTGLPVLLRDAHVLPIWEGTTNVLALDALGVLQSGEALASFRRELGIVLRIVRDPHLLRISAQVERAVEQAESWLGAASDAQLEAGARRLALLLARALELALLAHHAQWSMEQENDARARAAARRLAAHGMGRIDGMDEADSRLLARGGGSLT